MKIRTFISTTLLATTLGLGYTSAAQAHGDFLTLYVYESDYCPAHRVYHHNSYSRHQSRDRHMHHKKFLRHNKYRQEYSGHQERHRGEDRDSRHGKFGSDDHNRYGKTSYETGIRYTQRH